MNCKEIEKDIYLYDELTDTEKRSVDSHLQQCEACKKLFEIAQSHQAVIQKLSGYKPQPENYSKITSSIMQAIDVPLNQNILTKFFEGLFVRYTFLTASLVLIIFFLIEQQAEPDTEHQQVANQSATVILKTSGTLQNIRNKKETGNITSLYACVKSGDCENSMLKILN
jgi:hypothetical protein